MRELTSLLCILFFGLAGWFATAGEPVGSIGVAVPLTQKDQSDAFNRSHVASTIRCQGKLVPSSGLIQIVAPVGAQIADLTDKTVGQEVVRDEVLATLRSRELRAKDLALAKARREDAVKKAKLEKEQAEFKLSSAKLAVEEAEAADEKIAVEQQKIGLLERQLDANESMLVRLQQIKADPLTAVLLNQTDIEKQELMVDQLKLQIQQAQLTVEQAVKSAARAKKVANNNVRAVENGLKNADDAIPISSLDAAVEMAKTAYDMTELKSPLNKAIILDIIVREGDSVTSKPIMVIGDTSEMYCVAEVSDQFLHQIDLSKHKALRARITSAAIPKALLGTVIRKGVMIGAPSLTDPNPFAKVDRRTGNITIRLEDAAAAATLVGLQVDVEIETSPGKLK